MVQNPLNSPDHQNPSYSLSRRLNRASSQPIQPLRLPAVPKSSTSSSPPARQANSAAKQPPPAESSPLEQQHAQLPARDYSSYSSKSNSVRPRLLRRPVKRFPVKRSAKLAAQVVANASSRAYHTVQPKLAQYVDRYRRYLVLPKVKKETWQWSVIWLSVLGTFSGITGLAFLWLASPPPSANCRKVTLTSPEVQRLYCAQELARSGELSDLVAGIDLLQQWSPEQPLYTDAQEEIKDWSALILVIARSRIAQSDLQGAIAAASQIPETSPVYPDAQAAIAQWNQEWQAGETIWTTAQDAIKAQNWKLASQQVVELGYLDHEYWRIQQADVLFKKIVREKQARQNLDQAQKLAKDSIPSKLAEALVLVQKVPPHTYASLEAEKALKEWSQALIAFGLQQWQSGDTAGAFATAEIIPVIPNLPQEGLDLIRLSQAHKLVQEHVSEQRIKPNLKDLWTLMEAIAAVKSIAPESPFYQEARGAMHSWQAQLQDLAQLGVANLIAEFGDRSALEFAIAQASQVAPDHPRRIQAQSLIAEWKLDIQGLEDQPYLARAQAWAQSGEVPDLRAAIAQAQQIPDDRVAWRKAQDLIAQWTAQIETIEDQPIWDRAQKLAKQGKLTEAINVAAQIRPNRSLYNQAQAAIDSWKEQIRETLIAEDQPLLDQAYALAAQQRLSMAIDLAAQIAPGRPLYEEAQAAIAGWEDEREVLWKSWSQEPAAANDAESISPAGQESASEPPPLPDEEPAPTPVDYSDYSSDGSSYEGYYDERYYDENGN